MIRLIGFLALIFCSISYAETGYVYEGDLNGDGILDKIESGPSGQFGNAGGPFLISLSKKDGSFNKKVVGFHPKAIALETHESGNVLWGYWRYGGYKGGLFNLALDGSFKEEKITINAGVYASELASDLYSTIFLGKHKLVLKELDNYIPPEYPWGKG